MVTGCPPKPCKPHKPYKPFRGQSAASQQNPGGGLLRGRVSITEPLRTSWPPQLIRLLQQAADASALRFVLRQQLNLLNRRLKPPFCQVSNMGNVLLVTFPK